MRTEAARDRKSTNVSRVTASKRFGRYKPEQEKTVRKADVKEDGTLRQLKEIWGKCEFLIVSKYDVNTDDTYGAMANLLEGLDYTAKDVEKFSLALTEFQNEKYFSNKAGIFLSALINRGKDDDYVIHTRHLEKPIHWVGYRNRKNIAVKGDVGWYVGERMVSGIIAVKGDAGREVGKRMEGGTIWIKGNADMQIGFEMENGMIVVEGDVGVLTGDDMRGGKIIVSGNAEHVGVYIDGGEIHIDGNFRYSHEIKGCKVFHRGTLIHQ